MKKGRFLWSAHRITEKQKAGKARNIKEKQLKNSRNTVSKQPARHPSSQRDNQTAKMPTNPENISVFGVFLFVVICHTLLRIKRFCKGQLGDNRPKIAFMGQLRGQLWGQLFAHF